jgi:NADP-dependent 3-hydroxy acid dehydrogenase YdfG
VAAGGSALVVPTDVADSTPVHSLAQAAVERFGRIDTWVNDASLSLYRTPVDLEVADVARLRQVNVMGQVHGVKAALPMMRRQERRHDHPDQLGAGRPRGSAAGADSAGV